MIKRYPVFGMLIFLIIMFFAGNTVFAQQLQQVPNVVGMDSAQAQQTLAKAGFKCTVLSSTPTSDQNRPGKIASQSPIAGEKAIKGSVVEISPYQYRQPSKKTNI
jgi:beta-lactam-binding protein with PASTA domain